MPANPVLVKERSIRRIIRAVEKEGLAATALTYAPESGTITISLAKPSQPEVTVDLGDIPNEWDRDYGTNSD
jgi:hypothetical protein